jgi:signal transduction histidine kinase
MFEHLYRMAREVQARPQSVADELVRLLRELFEPLEARQLARRGSRARVVGEGASLLVPVPQLAPDAAPSVIVLGFAQRGQRMFTAEDAQLADRVVDQLTRAVAYDQAVERGRIEERMRIAQDLHDDIGARLLTLMYQAPTREMEDYLRHTLKDLKTLTRGLAAPSHRLSYAVAEWKADIAQRLRAADCDFGWTFTYDRDIELSVVQWSALTRVLRELVSNAIAHAKPTRVDIDAALDGGVLTLSVIDNGLGREPQSWAHGLGLGGVRKRVRQLGGSVQWRENSPQGIACSVTITGLDSRSSA